MRFNVAQRTITLLRYLKHIWGQKYIYTLHTHYAPRTFLTALAGYFLSICLILDTYIFITRWNIYDKRSLVGDAIYYPSVLC